MLTWHRTLIIRPRNKKSEKATSALPQKKQSNMLQALSISFVRTMDTRNCSKYYAWGAEKDTLVILIYS